MQVVIQPDDQTAALLAARIIEAELRENPHLVLGLATGQTMERVYHWLAEMHRLENLDFALCRTFNLDEYIGVPAEDEHSYRHYMNEHLFHKVNVHLRNTNLPDGMAADLKAECAHYEDLIRDCGGIKLQLLGIGRDGHIGFNEPLSAMRSRTRDKALTPSTIRANAPMFGGDIRRVPRCALTMGVGTILEAHKILLLVTGSTKADILAKAVEGPMTAMVTATALQVHPDCRVIVDEEAAEYLRNKDYYRWIWENDPEWARFRNFAKPEEKRA
jgi:glucosamine-6-phosphate deaminase